MKKNELILSILNKDKKIHCIVGPNSSGKSYFLSELFEIIDAKVLYIDEYGESKAKGSINKVTFDEKKESYFYLDETKRGSNNQIYETDMINEESYNLICLLEHYKNNIGHKNLSLGRIKLLNIIDSLLSYNLNNIEYVIIDEPENSLDDESLKIIKFILSALLNYDKKLVFVTHSPRLLELLSVKVDDIYLFPRLFEEIKHLTLNDVENIYSKCCKEVSKLKTYGSLDTVKKMRFSPDIPLTKMFINELLSSQNFYRALFYKKIVLVEGVTEIKLLKFISDKLDYGDNYFVTNGKFEMEFYIELFRQYCEDIISFIDEDKKGFSFELTKMIKEKYKQNKSIKINVIPIDIENYLNIDLNKTIKELTNDRIDLTENFIKKFKNYYKPDIASFEVKNNSESKNKLEKLFKNN